jgi:hypothetical protein
LACMIGPPADPTRDPEMVEKLLAFSGTRVVCGGTTAGLVARTLGEEIRVDLKNAAPGLPPTGSLPGIDLVCEGVITLNLVLKLLAAKNGASGPSLSANSGAGIFYRLLRRAETVRIFLGRAACPVRQNLPSGISDKQRLVLALQQRLQAMGKIVDIETF